MYSTPVRYVAGSIIKRGAYRSPKYLPSPKRLRYYGAHAIKYGPRAARAGKRIYKAYRAWKGRGSPKSKRAFKSSIGTSAAAVPRARQTGITISNKLAYATRTLYIEPLIDIDRTNVIALAQRSRDSVKLSGISLNLEIATAFGSSPGIPRYINVAVLTERNKFKTQWDENLASALTSQEDFFRSDGGNSRNDDFSSVASGLELHTKSINTDLFNVFMHKRLRLTGRTDASFQQERGTSYINMKKYIKINRLIKFQDINADVPTTGQVFLVVWCDLYQADFNSLPIANGIEFSERIRMYWRET